MTISGINEKKTKIDSIFCEITYKNNTLKQFSQPEGYVAYSAGIFNYIYQYKDHLGNSRLSYQDKDNNGAVNSSEIVQENNYYAFGLTQKGYNGAINGVDNKYKYNGKELQDDKSLAQCGIQRGSAVYTLPQPHTPDFFAMSYFFPDRYHCVAIAGGLIW